MRIRIQMKKGIAHFQAYTNDKRDRVPIATMEREYQGKSGLKQNMRAWAHEVLELGERNYVSRETRKSYTVNGGS